MKTSLRLSVPKMTCCFVNLEPGKPTVVEEKLCGIKCMTFEVFVHLWLLYFLLYSSQAITAWKAYNFKERLLVLYMGSLTPNPSHQKQGNNEDMQLTYFH